MDLLRIIIAILLPPLSVLPQVGIGKQFWINVLLTILGYIPGIVHAVWVIAKYQLNCRLSSAVSVLSIQNDAENTEGSLEPIPLATSILFFP
jgi:uncharacterized membrane protein YqaE (UPF0057 family)